MKRLGLGLLGLAAAGLLFGLSIGGETEWVREIRVHHPDTKGFSTRTWLDNGVHNLVITDGVPAHFTWLDSEQLQIKTLTPPGESILSLVVPDPVNCCLQCNNQATHPYFYHLLLEECFNGGGDCLYCITHCADFQACDDGTEPSPYVPTLQQTGDTLHSNLGLELEY